MYFFLWTINIRNFTKFRLIWFESAYYRSKTLLVPNFFIHKIQILRLCSKRNLSSPKSKHVSKHTRSRED